ncbi:predicted protein [Streptomyces sp. C]|nr:predicted protein [Streptomyces sp. C]
MVITGTAAGTKTRSRGHGGDDHPRSPDTRLPDPPQQPSPGGTAMSRTTQLTALRTIATRNAADRSIGWD